MNKEQICEPTQTLSPDPIFSDDLSGFAGWETGIESSTKRRTKDFAAHGKQS
jgi:hypothetical protein